MNGSYFSYLLIPFKFTNDYSKKVEELVKPGIKNKPYWVEETITTERFYEHIDQLIACTESGTSTNRNLGRKFSLTDNEGRSFLRSQATNSAINSMGEEVKSVIEEAAVGKKQELFSFVEKRKIEFTFSIDSIELYLFKTQIGFLIYKIQYADPSQKITSKKNKKSRIELNNLVNKTYYLKKLYYKDKNIRLPLKFGKDNEVVEAEFQMNLSDLTGKLLDFTNIEVETYFESSTDRPHQALVYTGVLLDEEMEEEKILEYLFYLRRSFKDTYLISEEEKKNQSEEVYKPFNNIYWGISMEGLATIAYKNENSPFSREGFLERGENSYFYLYMLGLHQRYALINYAIEASKLKVSEEDPSEEDPLEDSLVDVKRLKEKLIAFHLQWMFKHLSNITHYTILYEKIKRSLRVEEALEELNSEILLLSEMEQLKEEKLLKDKERKNAENENAFNRRVAIITAIFVVVQTSGVIIDVLGVNIFQNLAYDSRLGLYYVLQTLIILFFSWLVIKALIDKNKLNNTDSRNRNKTKEKS